MMAAVVGKGMTEALPNGVDWRVGGAMTAIAGGTASVIGGGKFANGAFQAGFGYLYNQVASSSRWQVSEGGSRFDLGYLEDLWNSAMARMLPPAPDAIQLEVSVYVGSANLILTRDFDVFGSWGVTKGFPFSFEIGGSLTLQYIDGGPALGASARSDIIGGPSVGVAACAAIVCLGRQWSPTAGGHVGTTSIGIGTTGISGTVGNSTPLGSVATKECRAPFKC
jgi:hypothetical protein